MGHTWTLVIWTAQTLFDLAVLIVIICIARDTSTLAGQANRWQARRRAWTGTGHHHGTDHPAP